MNYALTRKEKLITREELYKQVWATPMTQLAKDYGLSDASPLILIFLHFRYIALATLRAALE